MTLILRDVAVVDPDGTDEAVRGHLVLGDDGRIADVFAPGRAGRPGDARELDCAGLTAVPGLVDSHVHLCFDDRRHPEEWLVDATDAELLEAVTEHAAAALRRGVTTVRDLGSRGDVVRRYARDVAAGRRTGPRVLGSGPVLTVRNGHCHFVGTEVDGADDLAQAVDAHLAAGDSWIKVMVTGGALTSTSRPEDLQFDAVAVRRVVDRARAAGVPVAAHSLTAEGGSVAVAAGVRTVEHGIGLTDDALAAMRKAGQYLVPVLSPSHRLLGDASAPDGEHARRLRHLVGVLRETVVRAIRAGVAVLAGTDAGCPSVPHGVVADEIALLHALGLDPRAALAAATTGPARAFGLGAGSLGKGAAADLVLLDGDPLTDPLVLSRPVGVIRAGRSVAVH